MKRRRKGRLRRDKKFAAVHARARRQARKQGAAVAQGQVVPRRAQEET